ncbi:MAG: hypothetical protein AAFV98_00450 [Chloroflexota bacterium]
MAERKFPPEGYVPTRSTIEGVMVFMPKPEIDDYEKQIAFACPNCGGVQAYSVSDGGLSCTSCGYYQPPTGMRVGRSASTNEFITQESQQRKEARLARQLGTTGTAGAVGATGASAQSADESTSGNVPIADEYDWGEERRELECENCGASILLDPKSLTHVCPFCGSQRVVQHAFDYDKMRPRYLVPFKVDDRQALTVIREWLGSSWMTPADLQERAGLDDLTGIYLPFWTFSSLCSAAWRAQVGKTRRVRRNGKMVSETVWQWESGTVRKQINDLLVPGTSKLNNRLLNDVTQFSMRGLVEYDPSYLAGFNAQTYDVERDIAWQRGRELMRDATKQACYSDASSSKIRNFSMNLDYSGETWRYILLPVYLTTYRYQQDTYSVMVNGQVGQISGQRPVDWRKVGAAMAACFIPAVLITLVIIFFMEGEEAQDTLLFAAVAGGVGLLAAVFLVRSALNVRKAD